MVDSLHQRLSDAFNRGLKNGFESLGDIDKELFLIQHFIVEFEMNGLSGYFYNRLPDVAALESAVVAMRKHGFAQLAELLAEAVAPFASYVDRTTPTTWGAVRDAYDPNRILDSVSKRISNLRSYGVERETDL